MAKLITFTQLREEVRQRYDLGTFSANSFETTTAINYAINASLRSFYSLLMECQGDEYFSTYIDLTTTASVDLTSLPERFVRLQNLVWLKATDEVVQLEQGSVRDASLAGLSAKAWTDYQPKYRLHGTNAIRWLPTPSAVYTVRLTYVELPADLSSDSDTFDAGPSWDEFVINDVCAKIAIKEEKDPSVYLSMRADAEQRIRNQAPIRGDSSMNLFLDRSTDDLSDYELRNLITGRF